MDSKYIEKINNIEQQNLKYLKQKKSDKKKIKNKIRRISNNPIKAFFIHIKAKKIPCNHHENNEFNINNNAFLNKKKPKIAIYTCITGNYDKVCDPMLKCDNIDYYLFTDCNVNSKEWNVKTIDEKSKKKYDNLVLNRYYKFHPFEFIDKEKYDYSIYIDGNINVVSDLTTLTLAVNNKTGLALHNHCNRNDLYDEAKACCLFKKGNSKKIKKQIDRYQKEHFPNKFGLFECNVIVCDLNNSNAKKIFDLWWDEFNLSDSNRDQIAFPYVLWKLGYSKNDVGCLGYNVYMNPKFRIENHK